MLQSWSSAIGILVGLAAELIKFKNKKNPLGQYEDQGLSMDEAITSKNKNLTTVRLTKRNLSEHREHGARLRGLHQRDPRV